MYVCVCVCTRVCVCVFLYVNIFYKRCAYNQCELYIVCINFYLVILLTYVLCSLAR